MPKYRKKPVIIETTQWFKNGDHPKDHDPIGDGPHSVMTEEKYQDYLMMDGKIVRRYRRPDVDRKQLCNHCSKPMYEHGYIYTLEGGHVVCPGDWIITGVKGENYPCKPDIFEMTYEAVGDE